MDITLTLNIVLFSLLFILIVLCIVTLLFGIYKRFKE